MGRGLEGVRTGGEDRGEDGEKGGGSEDRG